MAEETGGEGNLSPGDRVEQLREQLDEAKQHLAEIERERDLHKSDAAEMRNVMSRRDFLAATVGIGGAALLGGLAGYGIGRALDGESTVVDVLPDASAGRGPGDVIVMYPRVRLASMSDLAVGEPMFFNYPLEHTPAMLVKLGKPAKFGVGPDLDIVAFSTTCPHLGYPLDTEFRASACVLGPCPGHDSTFDLTVGGQVTLGQSTESLPQLALIAADDAVFAEGVFGLIYGQRTNLLDGEIVEVVG